jgi:hypothetical protein
VAFLTRFRAWWTTRHQRKLAEYADKYAATESVSYESNTRLQEGIPKP